MKFLICGMGSIGLRHLRNLKALGYKDIIVYSSGKSVMPGVEDEIGQFKIYNSLPSALKQKPDVCMITNPSSLHVPVAILAANAGCHLYIEKPLSNTLEHLDQLQEIVNHKKLITFITYQFRFHPHIKLLKKILTEMQDEYGRPLYVTAEWSEYLPDWHPWEDYKQGYSARKDLGGGVLLTQIHPLNYLNYIFGTIKKIQINKIASESLGIEVDDIADLMINFNDGMCGHIHIDFIQKPRVHTMKIVTSKGRFEWDCHENTLIFIGNDGRENIFKNENFDRNDMFVDMLRDFISCVNLKQKTKFNLDEAIAELELIMP